MQLFYANDNQVVSLPGWLELCARHSASRDDVIRGAVGLEDNREIR